MCVCVLKEVEGERYGRLKERGISLLKLNPTFDLWAFFILHLNYVKHILRIRMRTKVLKIKRKNYKNHKI